MTAYRLQLGPMPSPSGRSHEMLHIREDGTVISAAGESTEAARTRLDSEPDTQEPWCGAAELGGMVGPPPGSVQIASALRHVLARLDPTREVDCPYDEILHSLIAAMAALTLRGPGLRPGTSRPYHFNCEGIYEGEGHVILSVSADGLACIVVRSVEDVRAVYEAGFGRAPQEVAVNMIGVLSTQAPDWARAAIEALTGQAFVLDPFVWVKGAPAPFGSRSTLMLALLLAAWPIDPEIGQVERSVITLPVGRGRVTLTPIYP